MNEDAVLVEVEGRSMRSFLKSGQKVLVEPVTFDGLRRGDVVLFRMDPSLFCHRLIKKMRRGGREICLCWGDNNFEGEEIEFQKVEGRVRAVVAGTRVINLDAPWARLGALAVVFITIPLWSALYRIYVRMKKR